VIVQIERKIDDMIQLIKSLQELFGRAEKAFPIQGCLFPLVICIEGQPAQ
jgi:hypothetical protein